MVSRTRATPGSPAKKSTDTPVATTETEHEPVRVVIAPQNISADSSILSLQHPRDGSQKRFLFCPRTGIYEFTQTATPTIDPHSTIFTPAEGDVLKETNVSITRFGQGWVNKNASILVATPFDLVFALLASLAPTEQSSSKALFQPLEDLLDSPETTDRMIGFVLRASRTLVEEAMSAVCDSVDAGGEKMYRYNEEKVLQLVLRKARRVVEVGLPVSLEERFVTRALEPPMMSITQEDSTTSVTISDPIPTEDSNSQADSLESQSTLASATVSVVFSEVSSTSTTTSTSDNNASAEILDLQRLQVACDFVSASYLPPILVKNFKSWLSEEKSPVNFKPLHDHLKHLAALRSEAIASRSMTDFTRKRELDDDEAAEAKAEKKRKQDEEEKKKKANESRGVRDLKKVNVTGMKKMSEFFTKKPVSAKTKT